MSKNLAYYMDLPYNIEIVPISKSLGGGFTARLPQVGKYAIVGDGNTPEEAIAALEDVKRERFSHYLEQNIPIPEPEPEHEEYSGRFVLRIPKILHLQLSHAAKKNQASLNQYVTYLLAANFNLDLQEKQYSTILDQLDFMCETIWDINYLFKTEKEKKFPTEIEKEENIVEIDFLKAA